MRRQAQAQLEKAESDRDTAKLALDRGVGGPLLSPSSFFMKHPPEQYTDDEAHTRTEEFIAGRRDV